MKLLFPVAVLIFGLAFVGCGGDDDNGPNGPGDNGDNRPVIAANTTAGTPDVTDPNHSVWNSVTTTSFEVNAGNSPPTALGVLTDSVKFQAVVASNRLFLRLRWQDDNHDIDAKQWTLDSVEIFRWNYDVSNEGEDQVYVTFEGDAEFGWDVWSWRSLTTAEGNFAEGMTWDGLSLATDSGVNTIATRNKPPLDETRPLFVHSDLGNWTGDILYSDDTVRANSHTQDQSWAKGNQVPGYYIKNDIITWLQSHPESRWDIDASYEYNSSTDTYTLVMACDLAGSSANDDLDLSSLDRVVMTIGILNDHTNLNIGGSNIRGFSEEFWLDLP